MITLKTLRITNNVPFEMYLLSDNRVKRVLKDFDFYNIRIYREERVSELTVCFDYPKANVYWFTDFRNTIETELLAKDPRYESDWRSFLHTLKEDVRKDFKELREMYRSITANDVVFYMNRYHLRDYQAYDILLLSKEMDCTPELPAGLILSEQRTGKTRVALANAYRRLSEGDTVLVVAPKSACASWINEAQEMNSYLIGTKFSIIPIKKMSGIRNVEFHSDALNVVIISYDLFKKFTYAQQRQMFNTEGTVMLIGDEVHRLRNFKTLQSTAIFRFKEGVLKDGRNLEIVGVTGTPTVRLSSDIFGLFCMVNSSKISFDATRKDFDIFKEYFYNCEDTSYGKICKTPKRKDELQFLMQISAVQTKQRSLPLFKDYKVQRLKYLLDMLPEQRQAYEGILNDFQYDNIDCKNALVQLMRMQHICVDPTGLVASFAAVAPKTKWVCDFVRKNDAYKGIVMSRRLAPLEALRTALTAEGIAVAYLDGSCPLSKRMSEIDSFRNDPTVKVFLIQLDAGKEALTLPEASYTIFLDRAYTPGDNMQAEARMTPIDGKPHTKYIIDLVMRDTIEEGIYDKIVTRTEPIAETNDVFRILRKEVE